MEHPRQPKRRIASISIKTLSGAWAGLSLAVTTATGAVAAAPAPMYDIVIAGGRVIDPETGLDAARNLGIRGGTIAAITTQPLAGKRTIDARNLVVSPGFIDLHSHGQELPGARMQAFDGVTTALELELGMLPITDFYDRVAKEGRPINYGASVSWAAARQEVMDGLKPKPSVQSFQDAARYPNWSSKLADDAQVARMSAIIEEGIRQGGIGVGFDLGYSPPSGRKEYYEINRLAAKYGVPTFTHARFASTQEPLSSFEAYEEMVAVSAATGAHMHVAHLNSMALRDAPRIIELLSSAQKRGVPITVEAYPYPAASTVIGAAQFRGPDWQARLGGVRYEDFEYEGKALDEAGFMALQASDPGAIIVYKFLRPDDPADQAMLDQSVLYPGGAIASDTMPWTLDGKILTGDVWPLPEGSFAHPRSAGTFTHFLRVYVRERKAIGLPEALAKITLVPAQVLEASTPQMRKKGRLQVGADADIDVFDPATVTDRATFRQPAQTSAGMRWVIVNGVAIIQDGTLVPTALPGKAIRSPQTSRP